MYCLHAVSRQVLIIIVLLLIAPYAYPSGITPEATHMMGLLRKLDQSNARPKPAPASPVTTPIATSSTTRAFAITWSACARASVTT